MKFVKKHRSDVLERIGHYHFKEDDFDFIKRRGRICIRHRTSNLEFAYLRKKETQLDSITRQWKHSESYKVKSGTAKEELVPDWEQVMTLFAKWLQQVMNQDG